MRRLLPLVAIPAMALALVALTPGIASACISEHPTFAEAVRGARAVARVTIVEGADPVMDDPTLSETYRVERILVGSLPETFTVAPARTSLCGDTVGYFAGDPGTTIVLAVDLAYFDTTIHPMWMFVEGYGVTGSAGVPAGVDTLPELEAAILAEAGLPATTRDATLAADDGRLRVAIVALAGLAAAAAMTLRLTRNPPSQLHNADAGQARGTHR